MSPLRAECWPAVILGFGGMQAFLNPTSALDDILSLALREPTVRIRPFLGPNGERLWLKRIEDLSLRLRLQKGDGRRAFANELKGLRVLAKAGLPVPVIVAEGPDHVVISDVGPSLHQMVRGSAETVGKRVTAFRAAGRALGRLHSAGFAHGRPAIRDICWDGEEARFIDLERFSDGQATPYRMALDVIVFTQTYMTSVGKVGPDLEAALQAYRAAAQMGAWGQVQATCRKLLPLVPLTAPMRWLRPNAQEFQAVPKTLAYLRKSVA
jgi:tRNA A-37 threonylcarbamoyl transferase component Bud32